MILLASCYDRGSRRSTFISGAAGENSSLKERPDILSRYRNIGLIWPDGPDVVQSTKVPQVSGARSCLRTSCASSELAKRAFEASCSRAVTGSTPLSCTLL
ncbi:hypothetical protein ALC57_17239 [Trachymyrmex cornetzi]|uniref:Uncharacterized protein n=1 Tax=Trachymyrmex cornetzi TaxID=471704 RepID=A0A195DDZ1_9HYME|nr:hypothetical protein ALC57_17239 [Trachymyrmex cornetzi]